MGEIGQIPSHQVRVDNWPLFFLQRLHHFYKKKSHCDLTLLFSSLDTVKSIKVHKLVLHACTDYFESLDVMKDPEHGEFLQLSNEMHPDVVIPIISFMYTGKLEFPVTLQPKLYEAATKLRMTILTKLLDVQPGKAYEKFGQQTLNEISIVQNNAANFVDNIQDGQDMSVISADISSPGFTPSKTLENPIIKFTPLSKPISQQKRSPKPEVTFIQRSVVISEKNLKDGKKNVDSQLGAFNFKPKIVDVNISPKLPGEKLPIWKQKVSFTGSQSSENIQNTRSTLKSESPKPTRFEWDEDLNDPTVLRPVEDASKILSHDGPTKITYPIILDDEASKEKDKSDDFLRSFDRSSSESPPYKKMKSDLQDMKEYGKQQQLRNEIICSEENLDDMMDTDDLYGICDDEPDDLSSFNQPSVNSSTPKPILKTVTKPEPPMSSKRVRFSLEGKENNQQENEAGGDFTMTKPESIVAKQKIVLPVEASQMQSGKQHIKIVSQVLKKFPNLAKQENIKLRVVSKNPAVPSTVQKAVEGDSGTASKSSSSLVSYIFLTNKGSGKVISLKNEKNDKDKAFDVENKTGPWICHACDEENPLEFDSYYTYRRHLVEVHELKIDARICEYCGLKNSKRNHSLYHLYTKHGINPPSHVSFPKCPECDYIALSDALLFKHKAAHDTKLMCYTCNVVFKTYSSMQLHLHSDWHRNKVNEVSVVLSDYPCPFCDVRFESGNDLKDHMETWHHSQRLSTNGGQKQIYRCPYCESLYGNADFLGKHIVSVHWGKGGKNVVKEDGNKMDACQPQSGQQLQYSAETETSGDLETAESQPSSEMESLNSVASSIATSLSLVSNDQTVIYYEQKTQEQDIGREATVVAEECEEYMIADSLENMNSMQSQETNKELQIIDVENEDSNSRTSNTEEVNPTSCSDHDYSEPHIDENFRQVVPVHPVANQIVDGSMIQQIVPDQGLVFANQGNVMFQSPCVNLPQRVLLTSGEVVIPRKSGDQNLILSQVLPQTQIILSGSLLQQSDNIIDERNGTIVFSNPEATQIENIQSVHYQLHAPENIEDDMQEKPESFSLQESEVDEKQKEEKQMLVIENILETAEVENLDKNIDKDMDIDMDRNRDKEKEKEKEKDKDNEIEEKEEKEKEEKEEKEKEEKEEEEEEEKEKEEKEKEEKEEKEKEEKEEKEKEEKEKEEKEEKDNENEKEEKEKEKESEKENDESSSNLNTISEDYKTPSRAEASKIVDDWDELNDSSSNIESRSDGPSRPEFF